MTKRLASYVYVNDSEGEAHGFGPDDTVPAWAKKLIVNPKAWVDDEDEKPEPMQRGAADAPTPRGGRSRRAASANDGGTGPLERPGADAEVPEWIAYARSIGLEVADDAPRGDVMTLVEDHEAKTK